MRMEFARALCLMALPFVGAAWANPPPAEYRFTKRLPNSEERVEIKAATFDDLQLCFNVVGFASDGDHAAEIAVYDASGREKARLFKTVLAKGVSWSISFCPATVKDEDAPGEWWFVATLDDTPVISASIPIAYGKPNSSVPESSRLKSRPQPRDPRANR